MVVRVHNGLVVKANFLLKLAKSSSREQKNPNLILSQISQKYTERGRCKTIATMLRQTILRPAEKGSSTLMSERRVGAVTSPPDVGRGLGRVGTPP